MDPMNETLQQLAQRRMRELGGTDGPISTRQVWLRGGQDQWSYETVRRIIELGHTKIGDRVADLLSVAMDVPVSRILAAAGQRPRLGRFELPRRADRLSDTERAAILSVVDAILDASGERQEAPREQRRGPLSVVPDTVSDGRTGPAVKTPRKRRAASKDNQGDQLGIEPPTES